MFDSIPIRPPVRPFHFDYRYGHLPSYTESSSRLWWKTRSYCASIFASPLYIEKTVVNFLLMLFVSQVSGQATRALASRNNFGIIRASSFLTLTFIGTTLPFSFTIIPTLHAVFLGSSFIGMTERELLNRNQLILASFIFCLNFQFLIHYLKDFGGALGFSAFVSCLATHLIWGLIKKRIT